MLIGEILLNKVRSLSNQSEDQIARACGYTGPKSSVLRKSFYRALIDAKGYDLPDFATAIAATTIAAATITAKGRQAEFRTRVHGNGNLLIGNAYTRRLGLEPGMEFKIEIHEETRSVWLLPLKMIVHNLSTNFNEINKYPTA